MRLLVLTQYFAPEVGATQGRLGAVVRELARAGHEVEVLTGLPNYPTGRIFAPYRARPYAREIRDGIPVHRVWLYPSMGAGVERLLNYASFAVAAGLGLAKTRRPDYLFVESPPLSVALPALVTRWRWKVPFIFNVSDLWPDSARELGMMSDGWLLRMTERFERTVYQKAAYVNAVTEGIRTALIERKGVPREKVLFLPNGVDLQLYRRTPPDVDLARALGLQGKKIVLYGGTHGYAHALEYVLEAARLLADEPDLHFLFVGGGSEKARLVKVARDLRLGNVTFHDAVPEPQMVRFLSIALCGLVPQRDVPLFRGNRPAKMFSIMASATPVVFAGRGEAATIVEQAEAGLVAPPQDARSLAAAIQRLSSDPALAAALGQHGRHFVEENLSWRSNVHGWLAQLEERRQGHSDLAGVALQETA